MNLRLISGKFGGRIIKAPNGFTTHPMSERVRGSMFNIIGEKIIDAEILDAFAGSGSIGLEAISRGASFATFVDKDRYAINILKDNINNLGIGDCVEVFQMNVSTWFNKNIEKRYDVIFTDSPYNDTQFSTVLRLGQLLKPNGLMVLSYPGRGEIPPVDGIVVVDNRSYGNAALAFCQRK